MPTVLTGLIVYCIAVLIWWGMVAASRPHTCPKGHTDHYLASSGWRCRPCARLTEARVIRRLKKEDREAVYRNRG